MSDPDFRTQQMQFRVEERLTYDQALEYVGGLAGQEQLVRISLSAPGDRDGPADIIASQQLLVLMGRVGELGPLTQDEGETPDARQLAVSVGDVRLSLPFEQFTGAVRLSLGPEVNAVLIEFGETQVLVHDVLSL